MELVLNQGHVRVATLTKDKQPLKSPFIITTLPHAEGL